MVDILVAEEGGRLVGTAMLAVVPNLTRGMRPFGVVKTWSPRQPAVEKASDAGLCPA